MKGCTLFVIVILTLIAGLALGLFVGWMVWPVQWVDASAENLRSDLQVEWINMAIDSYSVNQNAQLAAQRFSALGDAGPKALATVLANPEWVSQEAAIAYKDALVSQSGADIPVDTTSDATAPTIVSKILKPPLFGYIAVALFLALLAIVLLIILVIRLFGSSNPKSELTPAVSSQDVPVVSEPSADIATPIEDMQAASVEPDTIEAQSREEYVTPLAAETVVMDAAAAEPGETMDEKESSGRVGLGAVAAGAAVVAGVAAARESGVDENELAQTSESGLPETSSSPAEIIPVGETPEAAAGIGALAAGAVLVGGMASVGMSDRKTEESVDVTAEAIEDEATTEAQQEGSSLGETDEVVRAVEEVAGEPAPFGGVVDTLQGALEQDGVQEPGLSGVVSAGAAVAGIEWALEQEPEPEIQIATDDTTEAMERSSESVVEEDATPVLPDEWVAEAAEEPADFFGKYNRKVIDIEGIGESYANTLAENGITTTHALLQQCATAKGRDELAQKTGISPKLILEWANHADMMRIQGIGPQWSDLLEMAGVNTVREMAIRNPANLYQKLVDVNAEKKLVRQLPSLAQIEDWIEQAKDLPRILTY